MIEADFLKKMWYLRRLNLFEALPASAIEDLACRLTVQDLPAGTTILEGHPPERLCLINTGAVRLVTCHRTQPVTVALLGAGRLFGGDAPVAEHRVCLEAVSLLPSHICMTTWLELIDILYAHRPALPRLFQAMTTQSFQAERWHERLYLLTPQARLAEFLLELAEEFGQPTVDGVCLPFRLTQAEIGHLIGLSRESIGRLMATFRRAGWIGQRDSRLCVRDKPALLLAAHTR